MSTTVDPEVARIQAIIDAKRASLPSKNGTPPHVGKGVQLDAPSSSSAGCPRGLRGTMTTLRTPKDSEDSEGPRETRRVSAEPTCASLLSLPWEEFLVKAHQANQEHLDSIDDADNEWQLDTPLFRFVHLVWSRPDLGADTHRPAALFAKIETSLNRWSAARKRHRQEPPHGFGADPWAEWFDLSREDSKTEFLTLWPKFRFPANQTPIDAAVLLARRNLLIPSDEVCQRRGIETHNGSEGYCFFISVCGHLQAAMGDRSIFLPQETMAKALRVQGRTVSRWRLWAVEDGLLRQTEGPGRRRAARYRFDVSRWNILETKAPPGTAEGFAP